MIEGRSPSSYLFQFSSELPQRTLGERIIQAARLAAALHLSGTAEDGLHPIVSIGATGPQIRRKNNSDRALAA